MLQKFRSAILIPILLLCVLNAAGQNDNSINTYSPYTLYGIGDLYQPGFGANKGMGGITIGVADPFSINYYNPSSLSTLGNLSFLFDFGVRQKNTYAKTSTAKTSANNFNLDHIAISFRAAKGLGISAGITPYSDVGYDIMYKETDPNIIYQVGDVSYQFKGEGGLNQVFVGSGLQLNKNFSVGANLLYYFGSIDRFYNVVFNSNPYYSGVQGSNTMRVGKVGYSVGAQYRSKLKDNLGLVIGGTFRPQTDFAPSQDIFTGVSTSIATDTVSFGSQSMRNIFAPMEIGVGFTITKTNKLTIGADYIYQDWSDFNIDSSPGQLSFKADVNQTVKIGVDFVPNIFEIKHKWKRWNYRAGAYFTNSYMICNGERIKDYGITFGVGIPVKRLYSGRWGTRFNAAIAIGQRGTTNNGLVKENYVGFTISASIFEEWFLKWKYD